ncbi:hypothetical protein [Pacificibacter marinus]|uniref:Uncharacterized protein n=1 Tax=Pacificibacter marinus TaxID=658057 RepID=A0A1Y5T649_9RHOB|nr:hypothetical protein [Pacificibacter marinus]SEL00501.1 hypothetical protein SAMN04488032_109147 [Pacificibacter marinus]SLN54801.1 hypothetical protein PAM7971_02838 [Pacificibacter marinus]
MAAVSRRQTFRIQGRDNADKYLLGTVFVLGICGSLILKEINTPVWLPALYSGLLIVFYAIIVSVLPRTQLESDQIGDNAYYLGFVLTLTSLAHTLYQLAGHSGQTEFISDVISGFGVALSSTIVGVTVRVVCLQFRLDLVARDREARLALNDAMRLFRSEIADAIRGVRYLGVEIRQTLNEHHTELSDDRAKMSEKIHAEILEAFNRGLDPISGRLGTITHEIFENTDSALKSSKDARIAAQVSLKEAFEDTVSDLSETVTKISAQTQQSLAMTSTQISDLNATIKTHLETAILNVQKNSNGIIEVVRDANEKMLDASKQSLSQASMAVLTDSEKLTVAFSLNAERLQKDSDRTSKALDTFSNSIEAQVKRINEMPDFTQRLETDLGKQIRGLSETILKLQAEVRSAKDTSSAPQERPIVSEDKVPSLGPVNT